MMRLSIVAPCYNEADNIAELRHQLDKVARQLLDDTTTGLSEVEFVLIDDGSGDETLEQLRQWAREDARLHVVALSRNFGHQAALSAGLDHATGDAVVLMDADLQHPPEVILQFVAKWREGYDLIYAYREGVQPRTGYRIINALIRPPIPPESADFRLMSRPVVDALRRMPERARFLRGMMSWLGFRQIGVGYHDRERFAGQRAYTRRQTARMALNAVLSFSHLPLRVASILGMLTLLAGVAYGLVILVSFAVGRNVPGWTGLIMTVLVLGGVQLLCLGIIAEYIGRIFEEVKQRPLYVVRERIDPASSDTDPPSPA